MKHFIITYMRVCVVACLIISLACGCKNNNLLPISFESKDKMQAELDYTCRYDIDQDGENELIGYYSYENSLVSTCLVYDELNGIQEYTGGPGADNFRWITVINDLNINETYMALVSKGGLLCRAVRLKSEEEQCSVVEALRDMSVDGEIINTYRFDGEECDKEFALKYFENLKILEPKGFADEFSEKSLSYWFD